MCGHLNVTCNSGILQAMTNYYFNDQINESFFELCHIMSVFRVKQSSFYFVNHLMTPPLLCYTFNILSPGHHVLHLIKTDCLN